MSEVREGSRTLDLTAHSSDEAAGPSTGRARYLEAVEIRRPRHPCCSLRKDGSDEQQTHAAGARRRSGTRVRGHGHRRAGAADPRCLHRRGVRAAMRGAGPEQPLPPGALPSARLRRQQPGQSAVQSRRAGRRLPRPAAAPRHRARTRRRPLLRRGHRPAAGARRAGGRPLPRPARAGAARRPKRSPAHRSARTGAGAGTVPATRRARPTASFAGRSGQTTEPGSIG